MTVISIKKKQHGFIPRKMKRGTQCHLKYKVPNDNLKQKLFLFYFQKIKKRNSHARDSGKTYKRIY